jgi:hypothetical protein
VISGRIPALNAGDSVAYLGRFAGPSLYNASGVNPFPLLLPSCLCFPAFLLSVFWSRSEKREETEGREIAVGFE